MHQNNLSLSSQNFVVDFLRFNLQFIDKYEIQEVAEYLSKEYSCNSVFIDQKKTYSLIEKDRFSCKAKFLTSHTKHWIGTRLEFEGGHASKFYQMIKENPLNWKRMDLDNTNLGRKEVVNDQIYIIVEFYLVDFMKMIEAKKNTYQREQLLEFFDNLMRLSPYQQQFSDKEFRKLLFFPVVNAIQRTERGPWIIQVAVAEPLMQDFYPFYFPPSFFSCSSNINLQVKLSIIRSFAQEHSLQKTYLLQSFLNQYAKRSNFIQAQVKREILQEFKNLLKYEIIQPKFKFSVDGNHFIQKYNIQLEDIRSYKLIHFQEIIHY